MHDPVAVRLQPAQKGGQHRGGCDLGVVQQDDALARGGESLGQQREFLFRRHRVPVARPQVRAEHDDAARPHLIEQPRGGGKSRKSEERRGRIARGGVERRGRPRVREHARRRAGKRGLVGGDPLVDFPTRGVLAQERQDRVRPCVVADGVAVGGDAPDHFRIGRGIAADEKERRLDALIGERAQHARGRRRKRTVVERQHDFLVGERQRLGEAFQPHAGGLAGIDAEHARRAERARRAIARARRPGRDQRAARQREQGCRDPPPRHPHCHRSITCRPLRRFLNI